MGCLLSTPPKPDLNTPPLPAHSVAVVPSGRAASTAGTTGGDGLPATVAMKPVQGTIAVEIAPVQVHVEVPRDAEMDEGARHAPRQPISQKHGASSFADVVKGHTDEKPHTPAVVEKHSVPAGPVVVVAPSVVPIPSPQVHVVEPAVPKDSYVEELHGLIAHVADGDTINFEVAVSAGAVPADVSQMVADRKLARKQRNYKDADRLRDAIRDAGYAVDDKTGEISRSYRVRLLGVDAPETKMPMGPEAGAFLQKLVDSRQGVLGVKVPRDRYGRTVGDLFVLEGDRRVWVQEELLRAGWAWHYTAYDSRPQLELWMQEARAARRGLWMQPSPQEPWEWRKTHRRAD